MRARLISPIVRRGVWLRGVSARCSALAGVFVLTGCTSLAPQQSPPQDVAAELERLRSAVVALQEKNTVTELELQRLRVKVAELELAERPPRAASARPAPRELPPVQQRGPEDPIDVAPVGSIEVTDLEPEPVAQASPSAAPPAAAPPSGPSPAGSARGATTQASTWSTGNSSATLTPEAQALYDEGYTEYNLRQFVAAETTFQRFLQRFPNTSLADNAQYWIGESRYSRGDPRGALAAFKETVSRYPNGNKAPDALLRAGRVYEELGDDESALSSYRELVRMFPDSADALLAGDRIRAIMGN